jgi:hypothetical protein
MLLLVAGAAAWAATTYVAPPPSSSRSGDWAPNRYAVPVEGLLRIAIVTDDLNDVSIALDSDLAGYLERVVYSMDGNAPSWDLTITDADGFAIWADTDANGVTDPCSLAASLSDPGGTEFAGVPFAGGLTLAIADANQNRAHYSGDRNNVTIVLYIREAWRR